MGLTPIQWTDRTWSPLRVRVKAEAPSIAKAKGYTSLIQIADKMAGHVGPHCERVSHGCDKCYSDTNNGRCLPANGTGLPFDRRSRDLVDAFVDENILRQPLSWKKGQRIFVENQSDLFGDWNTDEMIDRVFAVMALCPQHTFQVLTKRPERMREYFADINYRQEVIGIYAELWSGLDRHFDGIGTTPGYGVTWRLPLPNVWLGISCEDQATADERIPILLDTPAAIRFISYEPALGPVSFRWAKWDNHAPHARRKSQLPDVERDGRVLAGSADHLDGLRRLDWVIVGGESGAGSRPFDTKCASDIVKQCGEARVACFVKQLGRNPQEIAYVTDETPKERANWQRDGWTWIHTESGSHWRRYLKLADKKGGDMSEWPEYLRVRQFPILHQEASCQK